PLSRKWIATPIMIRPMPRAPALVVACMRISRSGMRRAPRPASSMKKQPASTNTLASRLLIIAVSSAFQVTGKADGRQEGGQRQHHGHVEKRGPVAGQGVDADKAHGQRGHQF